MNSNSIAHWKYNHHIGSIPYDLGMCAFNVYIFQRATPAIHTYSMNKSVLYRLDRFVYKCIHANLPGNKFHTRIPLFISPCHRNAENWTFSMRFSLHVFSVSIDICRYFTMAYTPSAKCKSIFRYKHSTSNVIRAQLMMRFSSKRMCVRFVLYTLSIENK